MEVGDSSVLCKCGTIATYTQCKKQGQKYGKWFYGCANFREPNFCGFFQWAPEPIQPVAEVTQAVARTVGATAHARVAKRSAEPSQSLRDDPPEPEKLEGNAEVLKKIRSMTWAASHIKTVGEELLALFSKEK